MLLMCEMGATGIVLAECDLMLPCDFRGATGIAEWDHLMLGRVAGHRSDCHFGFLSHFGVFLVAGRCTVLLTVMMTVQLWAVTS